MSESSLDHVGRAGTRFVLSSTEQKGFASLSKSLTVPMEDLSGRHQIESQ